MLYRKLYLLVILNILSVKCNNVTENISTTADVISKLFKNYNRYSMPPMDNDKPHLVKIVLLIKSMYDISELTSSFTIRYYLMLSWQDQRLKFTPFKENNKTMDEIILPPDLFTQKGKSNFELVE